MKLPASLPGQASPTGLPGPPTSGSYALFTRLLRESVDSLLTVFFPTSCALCRRELAESSWTGICRECWTGMERWTGTICAGCGLPIVSDVASVTDGAGPDQSTAGPVVCYRCRTGEYSFDLARSFGLYRGNLRGAILEFKFHRRDRLGVRLGSLLLGASSVPAANLAEGADEPPVIVPVPLHWSRRRERGFNQAELLARGLSRAWSQSPAAAVDSPEPGRRTAPQVRPDIAPQLEKSCLARARATASQAGLSLRDRQTNVRRAFVVRRPQAIRDRRVILVDDVMTTGATASACAAALKDAGAARVEVLTLARATPEFPDFVTRPDKD